MKNLVQKVKRGEQNQTACRQCGTCCTNGGAALHSADLPLVEQGSLPRQNLITLRKGEFAHSPVSGKTTAIATEIIKLRGSRGSWACCYLQPDSGGCMIYENRPLACRTLKCWQPEESLALAESDLLSRQDILGVDGELQQLVFCFEEACPLPDFEELSQGIPNIQDREIATLEALINTDIVFRNGAVLDSATVAREELFLFGRPLFQLLAPFGFTVFQSGNFLRLQWKGRGRG